MKISGNLHIPEYVQMGTPDFALAVNGAQSGVRAMFVLTAGSTATSVKNAAGTSISLGNLVAGQYIPISPSEITLGTSAVILLLK